MSGMPSVVTQESCGIVGECRRGGCGIVEVERGHGDGSLPWYCTSFVLVFCTDLEEEERPSVLIYTPDTLIPKAL